MIKYDSCYVGVATMMYQRHMVHVKDEIERGNCVLALDLTINLLEGASPLFTPNIIF